MGRVTRVEPDRVLVEPGAAQEIAPLKPGDGVVFDAADWRSPEEPEEGGRVFAARSHLNGGGAALQQSAALTTSAGSRVAHPIPRSTASLRSSSYHFVARQRVNIASKR
jgi:hypothetical protein